MDSSTNEAKIKVLLDATESYEEEDITALMLA